jgi:hypothetical protein
VETPAKIVGAAAALDKVSVDVLGIVVEAFDTGDVVKPPAGCVPVEAVCMSL